MLQATRLYSWAERDKVPGLMAVLTGMFPTLGATQAPTCGAYLELAEELRLVPFC